MRADGLCRGYPLTPSELSGLVRAAIPHGGAHACADVDLKVSTPTVLAIGAFDGVHLGHRELLYACVREARARGIRSAVVTFDPDPSELLVGDRAQKRLLSIDDRVAFCKSLGIDEILIVPFTTAFAAHSPQEFVADVCEIFGSIVSVHVGENFRFGAHGTGDIETLRELGERYSFHVTAHPLYISGDAPVSSTRIRSVLAEGKVDEAALLLGRYHFVRGTVAHGRGEGTSFGFPTANVCCDGRSCMPGEGVYACVVTDGQRAWPAAANVGAPPTFSEHRDAFLEANLIGFEGDLYGADLAVLFVEWLRASRPFSSLEELERVVLGNIDWVRHNIGDASVEVGV